MSRAEYPSTASTVRRTRGARLAALAPSILGLGLAAVVLTGCGAGQVAQTDSQQPAINGASGTVGAIAVRNAELQFPDNPQGVLTPGSNVPLIVTIINTGVTADELTGVSSPAAQSVTIDGSASGTKDIPGGFAIASTIKDEDDNDTVGAPAGASSSEAATTTPTTTTSTTTTGSATTTTGSSRTSGATSTSGSSSTSAPTSTTTVAPTPALAPKAVDIVLVGIKAANGQPIRSGLTIPITFTFAHAGQITIQVPIAAPADNATYPATASAGTNG